MLECTTNDPSFQSCQLTQSQEPLEANKNCFPHLLCIMMQHIALVASAVPSLPQLRDRNTRFQGSPVRIHKTLTRVQTYHKKRQYPNACTCRTKSKSPPAFISNYEFHHKEMLRSKPTACSKGILLPVDFSSMRTGSNKQQTYNMRIPTGSRSNKNYRSCTDNGYDLR